MRMLFFVTKKGGVSVRYRAGVLFALGKEGWFTCKIEGYFLYQVQFFLMFVTYKSVFLLEMRGVFLCDR